jgi:hypothetical protein
MRYILWKLGFLTSSEISLKQVILAFLLFFFFSEVSDCEIFRSLRSHIRVLQAKISDSEGSNFRDISGQRSAI